MRHVHGLHHAARTPSARDSLYTHPVELVAGLSLLLLATRLVGPVHVGAFLLANLVYAQLNIVVHQGVAFPSGPWRLGNAWARKHHGHHGVDMNGNFANLTPFWDVLFGTAIPAERLGSAGAPGRR
jgi:sterol desaturase/sphingolipid hydroxylase (fatty acid hydroxylase superfamily)